MQSDYSDGSTSGLNCHVDHALQFGRAPKVHDQHLNALLQHLGKKKQALSLSDEKELLQEAA